MKNREAFTLFQKRLAPWFRERGFASAKDPHHRATWGWTRPEAAAHFNIWWQGDKYPFDAFTGSKFVLEFEISHEIKPGYSDFFADRSRLNPLLNDDERSKLLELQNQVIGRLQMPTDEEYVKIYGFPPFHPMFEKQFAPVTQSYRPQEDVWLRYHNAEDMAIWADFVHERIELLVDRFLKRWHEKHASNAEPAADA
jgi:hypothetical protein